MATKDEMIQEVTRIYGINEGILTLCKIDKARFFKWFDAFVTYDDTQRAYSFLMKGFLKSIVSMKVFMEKYRSLVNWELDMKLNRNALHCIELRDCMKIIEDKWRDRPQRKKRN